MNYIGSRFSEGRLYNCDIFDRLADISSQGLYHYRPISTVARCKSKYYRTSANDRRRDIRINISPRNINHNESGLAVYYDYWMAQVATRDEQDGVIAANRWHQFNYPGGRK